MPLLTPTSTTIILKPSRFAELPNYTTWGTKGLPTPPLKLTESQNTQKPDEGGAAQPKPQPLVHTFPDELCTQLVHTYNVLHQEGRTHMYTCREGHLVHTSRPELCMARGWGEGEGLHTSRRELCTHFARRTVYWGTTDNTPTPPTQFNTQTVYTLSQTNCVLGGHKPHVVAMVHVGQHSQPTKVMHLKEHHHCTHFRQETVHVHLAPQCLIGYATRPMGHCGAKWPLGGHWGWQTRRRATSSDEACTHMANEHGSRHSYKQDLTAPLHMASLGGDYYTSKCADAACTA